MNATDVANLEAEFRRRAIEDNDSTWRLAAALLITAHGNSEDSAAKLLNCQELAAALSVDGSQITHWHQAGTITPEFHVGKVIRFDLASVRAELAAKSPKRAAKKSAATAAA